MESFTPTMQLSKMHPLEIRFMSFMAKANHFEGYEERAQVSIQ